MSHTMIPLDSKKTLRKKARLNICIAKDLSDSFGGNKAEYLKRLNRTLKIKIEFHFSFYPGTLAKAA